MEEAVTRLQLAAAAGADVCFIEGVKTEELLRSTVAALAPKPVRRTYSHFGLLGVRALTLTYEGFGQCYLRRLDALVHLERGGEDGC